eukprot:746999-Hanusia_phi.AAC.5
MHGNSRATGKQVSAAQVEGGGSPHQILLHSTEVEVVDEGGEEFIPQRHVAELSNEVFDLRCMWLTA